MTNPALISAHDVAFGPTVTLDPQSLVVFGGGDWIVIEPVAWRDWNDDAVTFDAVWSTASKPETED